MDKSHFALFNVWGVVAGPYRYPWNCYPYLGFN